MLLVKEEAVRSGDPAHQVPDGRRAIARANALDVGLGGSVWGNDVAEATRYAVRLECGTTWVNQHGGLHPLRLFGWRQVFLGTEFNVDGLKEYMTIQTVNVAR